jgi:hypothetical protein
VVVVKSCFFCDIQLCSPLKVNLRFVLGLYFGPEHGGDIFLPKRLLTFNGLHGVRPQKIELYAYIALLRI